MTSVELTQLRRTFPLLNQEINGNEIIYFDNAATTQKPKSVVEAIQTYYQQSNANVHRSAHSLASKATTQFEDTRIAVQQLINAKHSHEIIWTSGTTEAINLVAYSWGRSQLTVGDEIIVSQAEHHANIVPWQQLEKEIGIKLRVIELTETGIIDLRSFESLLSEKTKLVSINHISNVIGKINPVESVIAKAKKVGAKVLLDAAQSIAHLPINVQQLDCDFMVFSAHKMYGPTGVGCLYGKAELLNAMPPYKTGGEMIKKVSFTSGTTFNTLPYKFETGTPNIAGVIGFNAAINFLKLNPKARDKEKALTQYTYQQLLALKPLTLLVAEQPDIGIFSFNIESVHPQDVASYLDSKGVAVRGGHHCAMPLMEYFAVQGCIRVSLALYNTKEEVDKLITLLKSFLTENERSNVTRKTVVLPDDIMPLFAQAKSWDAKHRQIMLLGKTLTAMPDALKTDETLVDGCESDAWLYVYVNDKNEVVIQAFSQAKIIKGLLVIVQKAVNNKPVQYVKSFDFNKYFDSLGLLQHLSPSRGNGLLAIVNKIKRVIAYSDT
ncbi:hypothetical protein BI291_09765 [Thalassotalea sp. PP2-459]|nr:hypothetical protein BI291_09765 [Thalassotalea sp. PP2-459]